MIEILLLALIGLAGVAAVLAPILLADRSPATGPGTTAGATADDAALDAEVERYRAALRQGTLCRRCLRANPEGSRYCAECGRPLDRAALRV